MQTWNHENSFGRGNAATFATSDDQKMFLEITGKYAVNRCSTDRASSSFVGTSPAPAAAADAVAITPAGSAARQKPIGKLKEIHQTAGAGRVASSLSSFCIRPTSILAKITAFPARPPPLLPSFLGRTTRQGRRSTQENMQKSRKFVTCNVDETQETHGNFFLSRHRKSCVQAM